MLHMAMPHQMADWCAGTPGKALAAPPTWRDHLIGHRWVQRILRVMVVIAVGAIMGDGVLTPAISGVLLALKPSQDSTAGSSSDRQSD